MRGDLGRRDSRGYGARFDGIDRIRFFVGSRERISYQVGLALHITNVRGVLCNVGQLVLLPDGLGIRFLKERRNKALMIGI